MKLIAILLLGLSFTAMAGELKITSLGRLNIGQINDRAVEVCAQLTGHESDSATFRVISDPGSRQGVYWNTAYKDARGVISFCQVIAVYGGNVAVEVHGVSEVEGTSRSL